MLRRAEPTVPTINNGPALDAILRSFIYSSLSKYPIVYKSAEYFAPDGYPHSILATIGNEQFFDKPSGLQIKGPKILE